MDESTVTCMECGATGKPDRWFCPHDGSLMLGGRAIGGEWVLSDRIGKGAMGAVYRARHRLDGRFAAVKLLGPQIIQDETAEDVQRFLRESMVRVRHPNCVEIHDIGRIQNVPDPGTALWWIRMEHVEGRSLEGLSADGPLSLDRVLDLGAQMCAGLQACHEAGIVHRDFKPSNVLIETSTGRAKVADFGIARLLDQPTMTQSKALLGTPLYMSPEQFRGPAVDPRSDLFALGVVLYELLTGRHPFVDKHHASLFEIMSSVPVEEPFPLVPLRDAHPPALGAIVMRLLQKAPSDRFSSAASVREALLDVEPVEVRITNVELGFDVTLACSRSEDLGSIRARGLAEADVFSVTRRILEKPSTKFGWEVGDHRLVDTDTVARACEIVGDARPVRLRLRVHPDVLLGR